MLGASGGAGHGELPRKFLPHPGGAWRREAPGETPGNATETRPPTSDENDAAYSKPLKRMWDWVKRASHAGKGWEAMCMPPGEASPSRLDESRLKTEGGLPPHAPIKIQGYRYSHATLSPRPDQWKEHVDYCVVC